MLNDSRETSAQPSGYVYHVLGCLYRRKNLSAQTFIRLYFMTELWLSIVFVLGALACIVWGFSYFTLEQTEKEHNREFYALILGIGSLIIISFKLYLVLLSIKHLRLNQFHPVIFCCELCCRACQIFCLVALAFLAIACYIQGVYDITDGKKGHR